MSVEFHPRVLISASLVLTALGSLFLVSWPSAANLTITYGFFGVSTIFLMWGALIKTTHISGGEERRSLAMGALDSGRGAVAAAVASLLIFAVAVLVPDLTTHENYLRGLKIIYWMTAAFSVLVALGVWISLRDFQTHNQSGPYSNGQLASENAEDKRPADDDRGR